MPRGKVHKKKEWRATRWARAFLGWCQDHPLPGVIALFFVSMAALLAVVQSLDWAAGKMWPPNAAVLSVDPDSWNGGNFSVTIENPADRALLVTHAVFRSRRPVPRGANYIRLLTPAVTYDIPFDCAPGVTEIKLTPPFTIPAKDVGAVVFRSTKKMQPCDVYVSLKTRAGQTKEHLGESLGSWQSRAP